MTSSNWYFPRNPKFTDSFERELAGDDARHIGRDEPSIARPALKVLAKGFDTVVRTVRFLRASAQQPALALKAS
ncbi:hypothetical protein QTI24_00085 [Variovorax sp. J22P240]|uniref:hypothetical protein n=1 Tax=unclassified Variovorax TaxID=663243 RepID=UPI002574D41C|nr:MULTISPECIES: hypothetical protein [unclassified Variovorax]MDL9996980.1 hypothetical protein [Variovorax sp. J22P240]MDM0048382.1 hypothetical protein [Variovorax sp. J22R115]